jgi:hypothetical protein
VLVSGWKEHAMKKRTKAHVEDVEKVGTLIFFKRKRNKELILFIKKAL